MLRDALRIGSVSGLSLQRTRCYRAVVFILSVTHEVRRFRLRTKSSRRWHALWVLFFEEHSFPPWTVSPKVRVIMRERFVTQD